MEALDILQTIGLIVFCIWNAIITIMFVEEKKHKAVIQALLATRNKEYEYLKQFLRRLMDQNNLKSPDG